MQVLKRTEPTAAQRDLGGINNQTTYDIPNTAISLITIVYLVVNILATSLSNYISNKPQRDIDAGNENLRKQNFKIQMIQKCLELDSLADRKSSLNLLLATAIFEEDERKQLLDFTNKGYIPKWPKRSIEPLNTYLSNSNVNYNSNGSSLYQYQPWQYQRQSPGVDSPMVNGGSKPR